MNRRIVITVAGTAVVLLALLGQTSAVAVVPPAPTPYSPVSITGLSIASSVDKVTGGYSRGSSVATFEGRVTGPVSSSATLTVNGKRITAVRDLLSGTASWSADGSALLPDDHETVQALSRAFDQEWVKPTLSRQGALGGQRDLLVRLAMLVSEAPLGVNLERQQVPRPGERRLDKKFAMTGAAPAVESCLSDVMATTTAATPERISAVAACQQSNEDGILYFGDCSTYGRWLCHDADSHCFLCETISAGPSSSECMGECGPGCNGLNIYTYDCGDHDRCGRAHGGSTNPWDAECGDEYFEADDDFLWGWPNC